MERPLLVSFKEDENERESSRYRCCSFSFLGQKVVKYGQDVLQFSHKAWEMGRSDPRKFIFGIKMGLALSIVSLLIFLKQTYNGIDIGQYSIWAIITVTLIFEFSVGGTFSKGCNRALGTLLAGILAFCITMLAGNLDEVVIIISVFIVGFFGSYLRLYPTVITYDYAFRVFVLTYCVVMVAGNTEGEYKEAVMTRLVLILVGAGVSLVVNICICPIWSGEDLHNLVVKNFKELATSIEGCVNGYLNFVEYERTPSKIVIYQASYEPMYKGYTSVMESKPREDTLLGFAIWEPPHGRYRMLNYPWKNYVQVSIALRHCASMVMALHGCLLSEIQAPAEKRLMFRTELQRVGAEGAKVLKVLGEKIEKMEKLGPGDILKDVHEAAEMLQKSIDNRSYLLVNSESWEIGRRPREQDDVETVTCSEDSDDINLGFKSMSEALLDLRPVSLAWATPSATVGASSDCVFRNKPSWPLRLVGKEENRKTYESASALSLATFASLLIEFVARLQNVVASFEELGEKAKFKEPTLNTPSTKKSWLCW